MALATDIWFYPKFKFYVDADSKISGKKLYLQPFWKFFIKLLDFNLTSDVRAVLIDEIIFLTE